MKHYIPNMFSIIKHGILQKHAYVICKSTKYGKTILNALWKEGFIRGYKVYSDNDKLIIFLKYYWGKSVIWNFTIISKPSRKVYFSVKQLWKLESLNQTIFLTTPKGILTTNACKKCNVGGIVLLSVS